MRTRRNNDFTTIRVEGAILPAGILKRVAAGDTSLGGLDENSYHLTSGEKINEAISASWNRLLGSWANYKGAVGKLPANGTATTETRDRWLLPLFQELGYGRLIAARKSVEVHGKTYPISHFWNNVPIHLVGSGVSIDKAQARIPGAARTNPHGLAQEFINRSDDHLWAFVSNGKRLRVLRDNSDLVRQAFVEFDLESLMEGEVYSDFILLWLLCHQSRVEAEKPADFWLEKWSHTALDQGVRALDTLRKGVQEAITSLGKGFLAHRSNGVVRAQLKSGDLDKQVYYRQLLRLVYRLIFLTVAEDRGVLLDPEAEEKARERYTNYYSISKLRSLAGRRYGSRHSDLYVALRLVMQKLGSDEGCPELALPALGSFLFSKAALPDLEECEIANHHLLNAVRALAFTNDRGVRWHIDYKNLGSEELGSVYESLLELHPELNVDAAAFSLSTTSGHERKTSGSYYTPTSLINSLLDSALEPLLAEACKQKDPEAALLSLKVCDPACGSGHFLIAAGHRIAKRLAQVHTGDAEPSPEAMRPAMRKVVGRCLYGVDINPMSVELCKVSLWMEAVEPGKPLSFLDYHIQQGNSLLGATPALMEAGIPDDAFKPIEGDDREYCSEYRRRNRDERRGFQRLPYEERAPRVRSGNFAAGLMELEAVDDRRIGGVRERERRYAELVSSDENRPDELLAADAWCASFVWKKRHNPELPHPVTEEHYRRIQKDPSRVESWMNQEILRLAEQYQFFHWHLRFPTVFPPPAVGEEPENEATGWSGGFDVVLGNPPWERIKLQEKEWFAERRPDIAEAPNAAARAHMIAALAEEDCALYEAFLDARRMAEGESHLVRDSGRYPLCGRGDVNTYAIFIENMRSIINLIGRVGCIVPSGIATDDTTKFFFQDLVDSKTLVSLYDFENSVGLFPGVGHGRQKFCLATITGKNATNPTGTEFVWFAQYTEDLKEERRRFTLTAEEILLLNPNTRTSPTFRSKHDAELTKAIYRKVPILFKEGTDDGNPWKIRFSTMFHMSNDSHLFRTRDQSEGQGWELTGNVFRRGGVEMLPLYEAKMIHHFNHRFGDYADYPEGALTSHLPDVPSSRLNDPSYSVLPRYWVDAHAALRGLASVPDGLLSAVDKQAEEAVKQLLCVWFAGAFLLVDKRDMGEYLLRQAFPTLPRMVPLEQTGEWDAAINLAHDFPLQPDELPPSADVSDWLETAEELINTRIPRWLIGFRDICRSTDERTAIFSVLPQVGVGHTCPLAFLGAKLLPQSLSLIANVTSFIFDYSTRQKVGGTHLTYGFLKQLPVLPPDTYEGPCAWQRTTMPGDSQQLTLSDWIRPRVLELTYTAEDLRAFASDAGYLGEPFTWDESRRFLLRAELDAAYFHLYGVGREDVDYIMETFPIVKRKDEQQYGEYRTKRLILEIYDEMTRAVSSERRYQTRLTPPPADLHVAHSSRPRTAPLVLPAGSRYPQPEKGIYEMRVVLSMLQASSGSLDVQRLMTACSLLAEPDTLEKYALATEGEVAHRWRRRFCDVFNPRSFLPTLDDLVRRGEIKLVRQGEGFAVSRVGTSALATDADIEFDTHLALRVAASLSQAERSEISPMATRQQIEARSKVA
jgi:hypothetical protein